MKQLIATILVIGICISLCACSNQTSEQTVDAQTEPTVQEESPFYEGRLEDFDFTVYPLKQLQEYLGPYCTIVENFWSEAVIYDGTYDYNLVNAALPGSCLRRYTDENTDYNWVYSVYDVVDGGYFYSIFFGVPLKRTIPPKTTKYGWQIVPPAVWYM